MDDRGRCGVDLGDNGNGFLFLPDERLVDLSVLNARRGGEFQLRFLLV